MFNTPAFSDILDLSEVLKTLFKRLSIHPWPKPIYAHSPTILPLFQNGTPGATYNSVLVEKHNKRDWTLRSNNAMLNGMCVVSVDRSTNLVFNSNLITANIFQSECIRAAQMLDAFSSMQIPLLWNSLLTPVSLLEQYSTFLFVSIRVGLQRVLSDPTHENTDSDTESSNHCWFRDFENLVICRLQIVAIQLEHAGLCNRGCTIFCMPPKAADTTNQIKTRHNNGIWDPCHDLSHTRAICDFEHRRGQGLFAFKLDDAHAYVVGRSSSKNISAETAVSGFHVGGFCPYSKLDSDVHVSYTCFFL